MYGQRPRHKHELERHAIRLHVSEMIKTRTSIGPKLLNYDNTEIYMMIGSKRKGTGQLSWGSGR